MTDSHAEATNQAHWDEVAPVHLKSYGIEGLLNGVSRIDSIQKREFYSVSGKDLIHLQCHIGTDTISLALDGANVTGVDFSGQSIRLLRTSQPECISTSRMFKAEFYQANVLDLKSVHLKCDIVTSKGVLCWIETSAWADTISCSGLVVSSTCWSPTPSSTCSTTQRAACESNTRISTRTSRLTGTMTTPTTQTAPMFPRTKPMSGHGLCRIS